MRTVNEDHFLIDEEAGLLLVCDGMGGHADGEIAAREASRVLQQYFREATRRLREDTLRKASAQDAEAADMTVVVDPDATRPDHVNEGLRIATQAIIEANGRLCELNGAAEGDPARLMGTTATGIWRAEGANPMIAFHVGDSRLYRLRTGRLSQLTVDQTLFQHAVDLGATENALPKNLLLQALGPYQDVEPEVRAVHIDPGDFYMLCSDGLHGLVSDAQIEEILATVGHDDLATACERLVARANENGGRDNITVVLVAYSA